MTIRVRIIYAPTAVAVSCTAVTEVTHSSLSQTLLLTAVKSQSLAAPATAAVSIIFQNSSSYNYII